ncbi:MAG: four helix bundle protein [Bacteroidales bacterium]|nr:four helix bundle protein [Bacteroidales bacterium]
MKKENIILEKAYRFALRIIRLYQYLVIKREFILAGQILKAGTSIVANLEEAMGGISRKDFLAKVSISYKEARESKLWLRLLRDSGILSEKEADSMLRDCEELLKIIGSIQKTTKSTL